MAHNKLVQDYASRIRASYLKTTKSILETGALLIEAKATVPRGMFARMFRNHREPIANPLPFSLSTAERLMAIGKRFKGVKSATLQNLPPCYAALYELSRLPKQTVARLISEGAVKWDSSVRDIKAIVVHEKLGKDPYHPDHVELREAFQILVTCRDEAHQLELIERFSADGLDCKALLS